MKKLTWLGFSTFFAAFCAGAAPSNDNFADAWVLASYISTTNGTTVGATKEAGEPNHAGNSGGHSVWFRWSPPFSGIVTFNTFGSSFDTLLAVHVSGQCRPAAILPPDLALSLLSSSNRQSERSPLR